MKRRLFVVFAMLLAMGAHAQQALDLPSREGVTVRIAALAPASEPTAVAVLLTGGVGRLRLLSNGSPYNEGNFLIRSRGLFVEHGLAVVLVDVPSDHASLEPLFRQSREHSQDLAAVIRWARERWGKPVWLVGTSRGTQSAASALALLGPAPTGPDGLVLTSSILSRPARNQGASGSPVQELLPATVAIPVFVGHHAQDACPICPPGDVQQLMQHLPPATSRVVLYDGGRSEGPPCEAWAHHGYNGIEPQVVADIAAFIAQPRASTTTSH